MPKKKTKVTKKKAASRKRPVKQGFSPKPVRTTRTLFVMEGHDTSPSGGPSGSPDE